MTNPLANYRAQVWTEKRDGVYLLTDVHRSTTQKDLLLRLKEEGLTSLAERVLRQANSEGKLVEDYEWWTEKTQPVIEKAIPVTAKQYVQIINDEVLQISISITAGSGWNSQKRYHQKQR